MRLTNSDDRTRAVEALLAGEVIVTAFNGIFVLVGDADDPAMPEKIATAKDRPHAKGIALVCPPEFLGEHVALEAPVLRATYRFERIQALYGSVHAVGLILPAAAPGAPPHVLQAGTVLNVWTEERPFSPLRELVLELRRHGRRALAGTSANRTGEPTITDADEVAATFGSRVRVMLLDSTERVAPARRLSASMIDLTGPTPRLLREGSVSEEELRAELRRLALGELVVAGGIVRLGSAA